jgi:hypothetical protein
MQNQQLAVSHRICRTCKIEKTSDSFYRDSRYPGGDIHCADCRKEKVRSWRNANPDRAKAIEKNSRSKNPQAARDRAKQWHSANRERHLDYMASRRKNAPHQIKSSVLKAAFGITLDEYNLILGAQGNACAICRKTPEQNGKRLAVDHCHTTLKVRGLLCSTCNQAIGLLKDSIHLLNSAISYLQPATI